MTREEATAYWKQRSEHIHNWLEENEDVDFIGEYVEAIDVAIEALKADTVIREMREPTEEERASVKRYIDSISADVVAVVRCKDCKWHKLTDNNETEVCTNKQWDISMAVYPIISAGDFCSYGERREP